jgi:excinuclease ABC subunit A
VLDEPSIGLHAKDVSRLIDSLIGLRDIGNSVIVVEHDYETIKRADWVVDVGPLAGVHGGEIMYNGTLDGLWQSNTLTAKYFNKSARIGQDIVTQEKLIDTPVNDKILQVKNITTHNLKNVDLTIPLGKFVCITGVSGSGKSSLINDTLYPALLNRTGNANTVHHDEGKFDELIGIDSISSIIAIDQSPIGRTPRSNPVTYTGIFTYIRDIFAQTPEAKARGYKEGRFSFNVKGGRCETCRGEGQIKIEMQFLPDMYVTCDVCKGKRYNEDALQIDFKGKNIAQVLDMTVAEGHVFFENIPQISRKLKLLEDVGLGYIKLGQPATTLSGGESQRIKLARELSKMSRGHTVYILDEPTTGLHFYDVDKLLTVLTKLVAVGHTVIVIEHNLDVVKFADWIIDLGPEGGDKGGEIVVEGTLKDVMDCKKSSTGKYLKDYI